LGLSFLPLNKALADSAYERIPLRGGEIVDTGRGLDIYVNDNSPFTYRMADNGNIIQLRGGEETGSFYTYNSETQSWTPHNSEDTRECTEGTRTGRAFNDARNYFLSDYSEADTSVTQETTGVDSTASSDTSRTNSRPSQNTRMSLFGNGRQENRSLASRMADAFIDNVVNTGSSVYAGAFGYDAGFGGGEFGLRFGPLGLDLCGAVSGNKPISYQEFGPSSNGVTGTQINEHQNVRGIGGGISLYLPVGWGIQAYGGIGKMLWDYDDFSQQTINSPNLDLPREKSFSSSESETSTTWNAGVKVPLTDRLGLSVQGGRDSLRGWKAGGRVYYNFANRHRN
jgi:hypothetical protein